VASITEGAKLPIMGVILGMAGVTGRIECCEDIILVALRTSQGGMSTRERESRLGVVERRRQPGRGGVAGITEGAKLPIMCVVLGVA
jgi:hypothetical protein